MSKLLPTLKINKDLELEAPGVNPRIPTLVNIVRTHHKLLEAYSHRLAKRKDHGLECLRFERPASKICGGMKAYPLEARKLEPLFPDLRNMKAFLQVGTRNDGDLVHLLPSIVKEEDFVVLMWDTDIVANPVTLEWGFLADLLSQNHSLVDELFIELHFPYQRIGWIYEHHSAREAFELLQQLRKQCNFAVHAWP
eukprot:s3049_g3.t1